MASAVCEIACWIPPSARYSDARSQRPWRRLHISSNRCWRRGMAPGSPSTASRIVLLRSASKPEARRRGGLLLHGTAQLSGGHGRDQHLVCEHRVPQFSVRGAVSPKIGPHSQNDGALICHLQQTLDECPACVVVLGQPRTVPRTDPRPGLKRRCRRRVVDRHPAFRLARRSHLWPTQRQASQADRCPAWCAAVRKSGQISSNAGTSPASTSEDLPLPEPPALPEGIGLQFAGQFIFSFFRPKKLRSSSSICQRSQNEPQRPTARGRDNGHRSAAVPCREQ